jgi:o-succinylbenzoate synthase
LKVSFEHKIFQFKTPSGTSRGILTEKHAWFLTLSANGKIGIGECSIIPGLSPDFDSSAQYEAASEQLKTTLEKIDFNAFSTFPEFELLEAIQSQTAIYRQFKKFPSLLFGFETAILNWSSKFPGHYFNTPFSRGEAKIPINGLVWMGKSDFMRDQMNEKIAQGFNCIKMKVGAIDFQAELDILADFRRNHTPEEMTLRVDANGAFKESVVRDKLKQLAAFHIHSIEQPIEVGQHKLMAELCKENILPIALDEELIGITKLEDKIKLLDKIQPQFIILKPSLHGGILSSREWIELAEARNIGWWMTSALESNVGLACIAEFTSTYPINKHHGLGTGSLYVNNIPSNLSVEKGCIFYG